MNNEKKCEKGKCNKMQQYAFQNNTVQCNLKSYDTIQHNITKYNLIQSSLNSKYRKV